MTKEEIVEMAKLSLWGGNVVEGWTFHSYEQLEFFAKLVAKRTWVGLTDEEVNDLYNEGMGIHATIEATEARLKEKNNG